MLKYFFQIIFILLICGCTESKQDSFILKELDQNPTSINSSLPYLTLAGSGELLLSWVEQSGDTAILKYSINQSEGWSDPEEISRGTDWFVNWADYPMVSTNQSGQMIAHYLVKSAAGTYSYDVNITRRTSAGWTDPIVPHSDGTPTEHGFVTMLPLSGDIFQLAWLDGRNTSSDHGEHSGAMTLRGAIMDSSGNLSEEYELDNRVCDCCQTTGAITDNGPVIVYRDRSEMEVRDISIVRKVDGEWTAPSLIHQDHWEIKGCPVNGPRADAIANNLVVGWYTAANSNPQVKLLFSKDAGATFGTPVIVDAQNPLGRIDVALINSETAIISWLGRGEQGAQIMARTVRSDGSYDMPIAISKTNEARGSGFPQIEILNGKIFIAWTEINDDSPSKVKLASLTLEN